MYEALADKQTRIKLFEHEKAILDRQDMISYAKKEGHAESITEGADLRTIDLVMKKVNRGKDLNQITEDLESTPDEIAPIYSAVIQHRDLRKPEEIWKIMSGENQDLTKPGVAATAQPLL